MKHALRRLTVVAGIAAVAALGYLASENPVTAQVTGACPTGQWVSVVGSNVVGTACTTVPGAGGTVAVANGGTGLTSGTSGGVLGFTASGTIASSAALGVNGVVIGGGAGATPTAITAGTNGQILAGATSAAPAMVTMSGDGTITNLGALTVTKSNGNTILPTAAAVSGTTGLTLTPLKMIDFRTATGVMFGTSASSTVPGITVTPGTGAYLVGTATSSGSTSNVAYVEFVLPPNYIAGTNLTIGISCYYLNGSSTASVHTMTGAAYLENTTTGAQGANLIGSGAVTCPLTTATNQTVTLTGTTLLPGSYVGLTLSWAVTNGGGASTEYLTGVTIN